jgi:hypothetical protein
MRGGVSGQPHIQGADTYQSLTLLDGFNVTQPANGLLLLRVSTDAIRLINVQGSRISAEYGKGSGGVLVSKPASEMTSFATRQLISYPQLN